MPDCRHDGGDRTSNGWQSCSCDYLTGLNKEQRRAAEHGVDCESATKAPPLLVIAGAGSGKTKTLAHRVAHLVVTGADPKMHKRSMNGGNMSKTEIWLRDME